MSRARVGWVGGGGGRGFKEHITLTRQKKQAKTCTKKARMNIRMVILLIVGPSMYEISSLTLLRGPTGAIKMARGVRERGSQDVDYEDREDMRC